MDKRTLETLLAKYGDSLASGSWTFPPGIALTPEERDELMALAQVRQWLVESLVMVQPQPAFRASLQRELMATYGEPAGWPRALVGQLWRHKKLTAAAASGVSIAVGAISVAVWHRARSDA